MSEAGQKHHAKFELAGPHESGILLKKTFTFEQAAPDVEIRLHVGNADVVRLTGIELRAIR